MLATSNTFQVGSVCIDGGNLGAQSVPRLIAAISQLELTGSLTLRNGGAVKELCFRNGLMVSSSSNDIHDSLGRLLLTWGQISQEIYDLLLQKVDSPWRMREGERLLSWGVIDSIALNQAIRRQILYRIRDIATWSEGCYIFVPGQVRDQVPPIKVIDSLSAAVDGKYCQGYLATFATRIFDTRPQRQFTSPFLPMVNGVSALALLLCRITGSIPIRGLVDFNNAGYSWQKLLILKELDCIDFALPDRDATGHSQTADSVEEDPILLTLSNEEEAESSFATGKDLLRQQRFADAEKQFLKSTALQPGNSDYLCRLAWSRILQNPLHLERIEQNMPLLEQAVRNSPSNPDVHYFYALALHLLGRDAVALCALERVIALTPQKSDALNVIQLLRKAHLSPTIKRQIASCTSAFRPGTA